MTSGSASIVAAWREQVYAEPVPELVTVDRAMAVINRARMRRRLVPFSAAAGLLLLVCAGLAIGGGTASPGDPLWGLSHVIDSDRAGSVEAAVEVRARLLAARTALAENRLADAARELAVVRTALAEVRAAEGYAALAAEEQALTAALVAPPAPSSQSSPAPLRAADRTCATRRSDPVARTVDPAGAVDASGVVHPAGHRAEFVEPSGPGCRALDTAGRARRSRRRAGRGTPGEPSPSGDAAAGDAASGDAASGDAGGRRRQRPAIPAAGDPAAGDAASGDAASGGAASGEGDPPPAADSAAEPPPADEPFLGVDLGAVGLSVDI